MIADLIEPEELTELLRLLVSTPSVTGEEEAVAYYGGLVFFIFASCSWFQKTRCCTSWATE